MDQIELPAVASHEEAMADEAEKHEAAIERQCVEEVFCLTGGELNSKPWEPFAADDYDVFTRESFRYWYDGAPDYAGLDDSEHVTVVCDVMFGGPPDVLYEKGYRYEKVATFTSSGKTECPCAHGREEEWGEGIPDPCPLCETSADDDSHYIYIGDGWAEVVYHQTRVCPECGGDFADLPYEYNVDERCIMCEPLDLKIEVYGPERDGGYYTYYVSDIHSVGRCDSAYTEARARYPESDVYLSLDGDTVRSRVTEASKKALADALAKVRAK